MRFLTSTPYPELETDRLILRRPKHSDSVDYHRILSCPEIARYSDMPYQPTERRSKKFVSWMSQLHRQGSGIAWIIQLKSTNTPVGAIRIYSIEQKARCGKVAYELHPEHWHIGLATEALAAVVHHAHEALTLHRLEAWTSEGNPASDRVLVKNGFLFEGTLREKACFRDKYWHVRLYGRLTGD